MSKTIWSPREELVCGKLDELARILIKFECISGLDLVESIRYDCERMEAKLAFYKEHVDTCNKTRKEERNS